MFVSAEQCPKLRLLMAVLLQMTAFEGFCVTKCASIGSLREQLPEEDTGTEEPPLQNAHLWFASAVNRWLDIACYKAMHRIKKAIELDQATQVSGTMLLIMARWSSLSNLKLDQVFALQLNTEIRRKTAFCKTMEQTNAGLA